MIGEDIGAFSGISGIYFGGVNSSILSLSSSLSSCIPFFVVVNKLGNFKTGVNTAV
jgi:hypothetical protein